MFNLKTITVAAAACFFERMNLHLSSKTFQCVILNAKFAYQGSHDTATLIPNNHHNGRGRQALIGVIDDVHDIHQRKKNDALTRRVVCV